MLLVFLIPGCSSFSFQQLISGTPTAQHMNSLTTEPAPEPTEPPDAILTQTVKMNQIILWVPPQFMPLESQAGERLQQHLEDFMTDHPGVEIIIRVKALEGTDGLLFALEKTLDIAPSAAPSLVLMPQNDLQIAAMQGLVQTHPQIQAILEEEDWYDYARQMALFQNNIYGLPFAADAIIMALRSTEGEPLSEDWQSLLPSNRQMLYPGSDARALFTLNLYLSAGGSILNDQRIISLDTEILTKVMAFFADSAEAGSLSASNFDYEDEEQVWNAFRQRKADLAVCWSSQYLADPPINVIAIPVPPLGNEPVTIVSGWIWTMTDPMPERLDLDLAVLTHLTDSGFQEEWTLLAGYLPVRPSSLAVWKNPIHTALLSQATISAINLPPDEILAMLGPVLNEAVYNVIINKQAPSEAARIASNQINE
jgi:multiple sugar transport system substrate-binding protein